MPGMQLEFDETGASFYYFLVSFYALILLPATYYFWPSETKDVNDPNKKKCHCEACQIKRHHLKVSNPGKGLKRKILKLTFVIAWILFIFLTYKVSQIEVEWKEFNPFAELGVDKEATPQQIRRAYKALSLKHHPDKGGDPKRFMRLAKAYAALTNEQSRKNWQEYGNPDGPEAAQFGIALPKWIVEKRNSIWVLGVYALVFMIILPVSVGTWWYRTMKFSGDAVLLDTTRLFFYFFHRSPTMAPKRIITILSGALEFERGHNSEIIERPSDNEEVPVILKQLDHVNSKTREKPFCAAYSVKSRSLIHAHLSRLSLPQKTLQQDKLMVISKCPYLINEMVQIVAQLVAYGYAGTITSTPRLEELENCMKVSQMMVQALWENQSPILQLPHISEDMLRHFVTRKRNIKCLRQLAEMTDEDRRTLLRTLTDDQYRDLLNVLSNIPMVTMQCHCEVMDEEDPSITAGSLVTVTLLLKRKSLSSLFPAPAPSSPGSLAARSAAGLTNQKAGSSQPQGPLYTGVDSSALMPVQNNEEESLTNDDSKIENCPTVDPEVENEQSPKKKPQQAIWEKTRKKRPFQKNKGGKTKKPAKVKPVPNPAAITPGAPVAEENEASLVPTEEQAREDDSVESTPKPSKEKIKANGKPASGSQPIGDESDSDSDDGDSTSKEEQGDDDDDTWEKFQEEARKENSLETKEKATHQVHCPFFPMERTEGWWAYLADRKHRKLLTAPIHITSLQSEEEVQLKFTSPSLPGIYSYSAHLKSDSYLDVDVSSTIKFLVKEAKLIDDHPQWKIDDEEEKSDDESCQETDSDGSNTDYEYED